MMLNMDETTSSRRFEFNIARLGRKYGGMNQDEDIEVDLASFDVAGPSVQLARKAIDHLGAVSQRFSLATMATAHNSKDDLGSAELVAKCKRQSDMFALTMSASRALPPPPSRRALPAPPVTTVRTVAIRRPNAQSPIVQTPGSALVRYGLRPRGNLSAPARYGGGSANRFHRVAALPSTTPVARPIAVIDDGDAASGIVAIGRAPAIEYAASNVSGFAPPATKQLAGPPPRAAITNGEIGTATRNGGTSTPPVAPLKATNTRKRTHQILQDEGVAETPARRPPPNKTPAPLLPVPIPKNPASEKESRIEEWVEDAANRSADEQDFELDADVENFSRSLRKGMAEARMRNERQKNGLVSFSTPLARANNVKASVRTTAARKSGESQKEKVKKEEKWEKMEREKEQKVKEEKKATTATTRRSPRVAPANKPRRTK